MIRATSLIAVVLLIATLTVSTLTPAYAGVEVTLLSVIHINDGHEELVAPGTYRAVCLRGVFKGGNPATTMKIVRLAKEMVIRCESGKITVSEIPTEGDGGGGEGSGGGAGGDGDGSGH